MSAGRTLTVLPGAGTSGAIRFHSRFSAFFACALAANIYAVKPALSDDACVKFGNGPGDAEARSELVSHNDPCALKFRSKFTIADFYDGTFHNYVEAKRWYEAALAQLLKEGRSGSASDMVDSQAELDNAIANLRQDIDRMGQYITAGSPVAADPQQAAFEKRLRDTIKARKDVGDPVCSLDTTINGYVEKVHNDKIQIRIRHVNAFGPNDPDELRWVNYDDVGICKD